MSVPACRGCGSPLGQLVQTQPERLYEPLLESGKDERGEFLRCLVCGGRNYSTLSDGPLNIVGFAPAEAGYKVRLTDRGLLDLYGCVIIGLLFLLAGIIAARLGCDLSP